MASDIKILQAFNYIWIQTNSTQLNSTNHRCSSDIPKTHPTSQACKFDTTKDMVEQHLNGVTSSKFIAVAQSIHTLPNSLL